jgi:hypothetical protein
VHIGLFHNQKLASMAQSERYSFGTLGKELLVNGQKYWTRGEVPGERGALFAL